MEPPMSSNLLKRWHSAHLLRPLGIYLTEIQKHSNMKLFITMEWSDEVGIPHMEVLKLLDTIREGFVDKQYGESIKSFTIILICRSRKLSQRKRFIKADLWMTYDIIADFEEVKNADVMIKRTLITDRMIKVTEEVMSKYKFDDFDKDAFLKDWKEIVGSAKW